MTSFLDIRCGCYVGAIGPVYYCLDVYTFNMVPTWHCGILIGCCNHYFILMWKCL